MSTAVHVRWWSSADGSVWCDASSWRCRRRRRCGCGRGRARWCGAWGRTTWRRRCSTRRRCWAPWTWCSIPRVRRPRHTLLPCLYAMHCTWRARGRQPCAPALASPAACRAAAPDCARSRHHRPKSLGGQSHAAQNMGMQSQPRCFSVRTSAAGLVRSVAAGVGDLVGLPLAALGRGSPTAFVAGLGTGSASLLRNLSGGAEQHLQLLCC